MKQNDLLFYGYAGSGINHLRWLCFLANSFYVDEIKSKEDKIKFILEKVYHRENKLKDWINLEFEFRDDFDRKLGMYIRHNNHALIGKKPEYPSYVFSNKVIFLHTPPDICFKRYVKLSYNKFGHSHESFLGSCDFNNKDFLKRVKNCLVVDGKNFYNRILDKKIINDLNSYLQIDIPYDEAAFIHRVWYDLDMTVSRQFVKLIIDLYKDDLKCQNIQE